MNLRPIKKSDYKLLLELDKKVYPTDSPVTAKILNKWYKNNSDFCLIYEENGKIMGVCLAILLNENGWKRLINGKLNESDLDEKTLFNNNRDSKLGLHIYHIEKLDNKIKGFYKICLQDLSKLIKYLQRINGKLRVIGFSGLCVTPEGISLFEDKLKCKEREFVSNENIIIKGDKRKIIIGDKSDFIIPKGYCYLNKCKMLVSYPGEESVVWGYFN